MSFVPWHERCAWCHELHHGDYVLHGGKFRLHRECLPCWRTYLRYVSEGKVNNGQAKTTLRPDAGGT